MNDQSAGFVVVDVWRVKAGKENAIRQVLADAHRRFLRRPEILSVDYCLVDGEPDRYLVVFRYTDESARESFIQSEDLRTTMETLSELWDLDGCL
jgi:quinol monooxygenase YgiN